MRYLVLLGLMEKYYYITINRVDKIFDLFYWPVVGLLVWGFTTYYLREFTGDAILHIFLGGTVLWIFFQRAAQDIAVYLLEDFWSQNLFNLFATPLKSLELMVSIIIFGTLRSVISFVFLIFVALFLYSFNIFDAGIFVIALGTFNLLLSGWAVGLLSSSMIFRYGVRIQVLAWSIPFLILPFSAVYYPLETVPVWIQSVASLLPTTYVFEAMRYGFEQGGILWGHMGIAFALNIVLILALGWNFSRSVEKARIRGAFVKKE